MSSFFLDQATAKRYAVGRAFIYEGRQYTSAGANPVKFKELGFIEVQIQPRPDDRFYINNGQCKDDGSWDSSPRDLAELKESFVSEQETQQGSILSSSDWLVTRKQETGKDIPADWAAYRQAVRDAGDARVSKIKAVKSIGKLQALINAPAEVPVDLEDPDAGMKPNPDAHLEPWPLDPDAQAEAAKR